MAEGCDSRFGSVRQAQPVAFRLGLDLDNCSGQYERALADYAGPRLGRRLPPLSSWDGWGDWGLTRREFFGLHDAAVEDGLFARLKPVGGITDAMWTLSDAGVAIAIVTSRLTRGGRHAKVLGDTAWWLDNVTDPHANDPRNGIPYVELHVTGDKASVGCHLYVDDAPGHIEAIRAVHGPNSAIVFDRPYNRHLPGPRITAWDDRAVELVLSARERHLTASTAA